MDKPKKYVTHCLERITKVEQLDLNDIQVIETNRLFKVKSCSKEIFHQLDLRDKYRFPTSTCHDWKKYLMPCKHSLALFEHKTGISWNSLGDIYKKWPYFNINYEVSGLDVDTSLSILLQIIMMPLLTYHFKKRNQEKTIYLLKTMENRH